MEWKTVKLQDVCIRITDGSHFSPQAQVDGYPMFSVKDMLEYGFDYSNCKRISKADFEGMVQNDCVPQKGDVLVAKDGSFLKSIFLCRETKEEAILSSIAIFRPDIKKILPAFLCYLLKSPSVYNYIASNCVSGSALPRIVLKDFKQVDLSIPGLETQCRIAAILSSLDDKIENNNRINRNLEAQAQALFKSWFIDFEPFGGVLPEDWEETTIGEICKCYLGGTPSRAKAEYWNGEIPWVNSGEVNKYRILEGSEYITELGLQKSATKLLPRKTTVLAITGATLGQVSLLEIEACANQSVIGIVQNEKVPYEFIYPLILNDIEQIMLHQTGGAQQHINKDNVESHKLILPTDEVMAKYKAIQAPLFETIANNCFESQRLAALRDTLLPKLMKGEIEL
jgi:type I restriction enzyme S subunit